ncbi:MAG: division/cell wall cluster transcriptional repressor MraZ [Candidatus Neomarinimicrobiota bacterium]|nr:MAG: division/cell wall cluster transcriptional repressor MraZ [Candidatus Neomarinimicrobiota bacterium]
MNKDTFTGEYRYALDAKGRVNIPAPFRKVLSPENENTVVITRGQDPTIWVYPALEWQVIENRLRELSALSPLNRSFIRTMTRWATPVTLDKQGRIQLTSDLIQYANLEKDVVIVGVINKMEIWNPARLEQVSAEIPQSDSEEFNNLAQSIII